MTCERCGKTYRAKESSANRRKYCSKGCSSSARSEKAHVDKTCPTCNTVFRVRSVLGRKYCSPKCAAVANAKAKVWGDGYVSNQGYKVLTQKGQRLLEHRVLMEQMLGRPLLPFESVHHKDGNRLNNVSSNLELWVTAPRYGQRQADMIPWAIQFLESAGYVVTKKQEASSPVDAGAPMWFDGR
jgi:HNH endonuclease